MKRKGGKKKKRRKGRRKGEKEVMKNGQYDILSLLNIVHNFKIPRVTLKVNILPPLHHLLIWLLLS